jgi:hypothetical protein
MDPETLNRARAHVQNFYKTCSVCNGESLLLYPPVSLRVAKTPLTSPVEFTELFEQFFPVICRNCGSTVFFSARTVTNSDEK